MDPEVHRLFTARVEAVPTAAVSVARVTSRAAARPTPVSPQSRRTRPRLSFELDESKLDPPQVRQGIVARTALVDHLVAVHEPSVIAVVAPAGYGKTTLLAQWVLRKQPRAVWLSVDTRDNDPTVLLTYIAVAFDRVDAGPCSSRPRQCRRNH